MTAHLNNASVYSPARSPVPACINEGNPRMKNLTARQSWRNAKWDHTVVRKLDPLVQKEVKLLGGEVTAASIATLSQDPKALECTRLCEPTREVSFEVLNISIFHGAEAVSGSCIVVCQPLWRRRENCSLNCHRYRCGHCGMCIIGRIVSITRTSGRYAHGNCAPPRLPMAHQLLCGCSNLTVNGAPMHHPSPASAVQAPSLSGPWPCLLPGAGSCDSSLPHASLMHPYSSMHPQSLMHPSYTLNTP